jgi:hypothetical protein
MTRKEFIELAVATGSLFGIGKAGLAADEASHASALEPAWPGGAPNGADNPARLAHDGPVWRTGRRRITDWSSDIDATPEQIFPLLCPVREYEWLEGWTAEMVYSESGVAEDHCVFTTHRAGEMATWVVSRYEPPTRVEFVRVTPDVDVCGLRISLERVPKGTRLRWLRVFTGLSDRGNQAIETWTTSHDLALSGKIEYFVRHGTMKTAR